MKVKSVLVRLCVLSNVLKGYWYVNCSTLDPEFGTLRLRFREQDTNDNKGERFVDLLYVCVSKYIYAHTYTYIYIL